MVSRETYPKKQQANNTHRNIVVKFKGRSMTLTQAANRLGVDMRRLWNRIDRLGWTPQRALSTPIRTIRRDK